MFKSLFKHASNQRPIVNSALRISFTLVEKVSGPVSDSTVDKFDQLDLNPEELRELEAYKSMGSFWVNNLYPIKRGIIDLRNIFPHAYDFPVTKLPKVLESVSNNQVCFRLLSARPYYRDGGCIVDIGVKIAPGGEANPDLWKPIKDKLKEKNYHAPLTINRIDIFEILGKPWLNDLISPSPFSGITIEIYNKNVAMLPKLEEHLYQILRSYGKLIHVIVEDRSMKDNKPVIIKAKYRRLPGAIAARMCLHGADFFKMIGKGSSDENAVLVINYQPFDTRSVFTTWWTKHPRIFAVILGILLASMSYTIIDPIRKVFIRIKLWSNPFDTRNIFQVFMSQFVKFIKLDVLFNSPKNDLIDFPLETEEHLVKFLRRDVPDTILYLTGAQGTGKSRLARKAVTVYQPHNSIFLDFEEICQATDDDEFIRILARKVGFFPTFRVLETFGSVVDAFTPGAGKATFAPPPQKTQKILQIMSAVFQELSDTAKHPEGVPLLVIDGFSDVYLDKHANLLPIIFQAVEYIVRFRLARVIFVGDSTFETTGGLGSLLPNAKVEKIVFADISLESARNLIAKKTNAPITAELDEAIGILGGRLGDMRMFINRINAGQAPMEAVNAIIDTSKDELRKILFEYKKPKTQKEYTTVQLWKMITLLAEQKNIPYDFVLFSIFKGDDKALRSLIQTKLFSIVPTKDKTDGISASSPVIQRAFEELRADKLICSGLNLNSDTAAYQSEEKLLKAYEEELIQLKHSGMYDQKSPAIKARVEFLIGKILDSQQKLEQFDKKIQAYTAYFKKVPQPE